MSSIATWARPRGLSAVLFVIENLKFTIKFPKFSDQPVTADFGPGIHLIYGESGVGKSDLIRQLVGLPPFNRHNYQLINKSVPGACRVLFQNPDNQIICSTVGRELAFSVECVEQDPKILRDRIARMQTVLPPSIGLNRHPVTLSGGEKEILNLVNAAASAPRVILIDDGLSFLAEHNKAAMAALLRELATDGKAIILWFSSDLNDGRLADTVSELNLAQFRTGVSLRDPGYPHQPLRPGKLTLTIGNLHFGYDHQTLFDNYCRTLTGCRSLGINGRNGSGKTTLAKLLTGVYHGSRGRLSLTIDDIDQPLIGYLDQFPERMIGSASLDDFVAGLVRNSFIAAGNLRQCCRRLQEYQINWDLIRRRNAGAISWSTLRFTLVLLLAHCHYDLLILDEPTFGLGGEQRRRLIGFLQEYLQQKHLILISHDPELIDCLCDRTIDLNPAHRAKKSELEIG
ncbi:MAG: ATP-binding cassette domain-containing protein [Candidatus Neomarinimicrobiota bacterium]